VSLEETEDKEGGQEPGLVEATEHQWRLQAWCRW
jgi:hypothetical protein